MRPAFLTFNKAVDLLHQGGRPQVMHAGLSKRDWFVIHRDGGRRFVPDRLLEMEARMRAALSRDRGEA
jgi:hypothetical protein